MFGSGMNLITTIIGFGMSATFIVFVCTRLICGRISRRQSRQMFEIESGIDLEMPEHRINGLDSVVVAAIPTMKFHREAFTSSEDTQCSICLSEYQENEVLRIMPKCGHSFHLSCIDIWLRKQSTCPVCRLSVPESIENKQRRPPMLVRDQNSDSSEISVEHSRQWLLPIAEQSQGTVSNSNEAVSVSINPASAVSAEAATRS
ncbi:RING-H2 finger protein ATL67 [Nicotiana tabacum]|uniref:RING-H2 finger protein ATL67 n=2 Tax=Nicotiana TaxID=4085 RepID=A0A1S4AV75_TOBAC|nr:PREDICTED: RING-H2 finger protein ATL67-like [Nicotiana sylvestris]XP_016480501.1 PREDICTED: RING-H2 finger protein ATL67-like [Nicotiana tabacum]